MRLFGKLQPVPVLARGERLSFSSKLDRLAGRLKQPEWRRYAKLLFAGKILGMRSEQIAEILGCPQGTVASRLNRAHKLLERRLAGLRNTLGGNRA